MAKSKIKFVCNSCGSVYPKWAGKCNGCNEWNTLEEKNDTAVPLNSSGAKRSRGKILDFCTLDGVSEHAPRITTGINEFDRVCGGGLVEGMVALIGPDPGIGEYTLLLQVASAVSKLHYTAYVSGEESLDQVRLRATRLSVEKSAVQLASSTNMSDILATMESPNKPKVLIVDSIQTMFLDTIESAPGTVAQVRACAGELVRCAKANGVSVLIVGHVTKDGAIAGPRVLEHMVDTVLYFEGERTHHYRILRSVKNRFGATDEIGVFDMTHQGLQEVADPSAMFLSEHNEGAIGSSVFAGVEGTRPVLVEIQALISPTAYSTPKRSVVGWDTNRLSMLLAVLESRADLGIMTNDVYLNVAGGLKISEPAADVAVAAALISSLMNKPLPKGAIFFGEIGLNGEIRPASQTEARLKESSKLGFENSYIPPQSTKIKLKSASNIIEIRDVNDLVNIFRNL